MYGVRRGLCGLTECRNSLIGRDARSGVFITLVQTAEVVFVWLDLEDGVQLTQKGLPDRVARTSSRVARLNIWSLVVHSCW